MNELSLTMTFNYKWPINGHQLLKGQFMFFNALTRKSPQYNFVKLLFALLQKLFI